MSQGHISEAEQIAMNLINPLFTKEWADQINKSSISKLVEKYQKGDPVCTCHPDGINRTPCPVHDVIYNNQK